METSDTGSDDIMGSLTVKVEIRLTKEDAALLAKVVKARRSSQSSIIREALMAWFARKGLLSEEETKMLLLETYDRNRMKPPGSEAESRRPDRPPNTRWSP